jgi:predicted enzyme related to lactoylglutathione lyase
VEGSGTTSLNISVRDIEAARSALEGRGVEFTGPIIDIPGVVRLADFRDPDGNKIRLAGAPRKTAAP